MSAKKPSRSKRPQQAKAAVRPDTKTEPAVAAAQLIIPKTGLPTAWQVAKSAAKILRGQWKFYLGLMLILGALNIFFVHNVGDVPTLKGQVSQLLGRGTQSPTTGLATYTLLLSNSAGGTSGAANVYQYVLLIVGSLAVIWSLRQFLADKPVAALRIRDAFYKGMYPLVPFVLVLFVLVLELLPVLLGSFVYNTIVSGGIATTVLEQSLWLLVLLAGFAISVWLVTFSMFAMYIVTLPDMEPWAALRNARQIVRGRQLNIVRKLLFLVVGLFIVSAVIMLPCILILSSLAGIVFFGLSLAALLAVHSYLYVLYRELLA